MNCTTCGSPRMAGEAHCLICGAPFDPALPYLPIGTVLQHKYRIDQVLGQGGFGITYGATQLNLGLRVAIKELFLPGSVRTHDTLKPPSALTPAEWKQAQDDFAAEGRILARFQHPDIVRVMDVLNDHNTTYLVMEHLQGQTLQNKIDADGPLPASFVENLALRTLDALSVVHQAGLLHRDLKPENIFLEHTGRTVLIDFGAARDYLQGQTVAHTRLITPGYAPLEQYSSAAKFGPYTDLYALGATLYHALTGEAPPAATDRVMDDTLKPLPASIPSRLRTTLGTSLQLKVKDRPQDVSALQAILKSAPPPRPAPPVPSPPAPTPIPPRVHKRPTPVWVGTLAFLAVVAVFFFLARLKTEHLPQAQEQHQASIPETPADPEPATPPTAEKETSAQPTTPTAEDPIEPPSRDPDQALEGYAPVAPLSSSPERLFSDPPESVLLDHTDYLARVDTSSGTFVMDLFEEDTPTTVNSFVFLALHFFYDDIKFHRVIDGFVVQGGDPNTLQEDRNTWGQGGPGYQFGLEVRQNLNFDEKGILGMARAQDPNSNGSQFYITLAPTPSLNGQYTVFGKVLAGLDVLDRIKKYEAPSEGQPDFIKTITIYAKSK